MTGARWCSRSKRCARKARSSARYRPLSPDREEVVNRLCLRVLAAIALASLPTGAALSAELTAQDYPARPIRLIVSFPAGSSDVLGRAFAQHATLGQPVVVENVPGANGAIGLTRLAKSAPDGHTVALGATTNLAVSPHLNSKLPYDPLKDFAPIALLARVPIVLVVNAAVPARSVAELVALARAHPGTTEAIVQRLAREVRRVLSLEAMKRFLDDHGIEAGDLGPEALKAYIASEHARYGRMVREAGVQVE